MYGQVKTVCFANSLKGASKKKFGTNHIERYNLSLRTHLKRLARRSICFTKSLKILQAILKIYFWG
ncbi:IS1 family transposase [Niabella ginsengisoli]|uniref:IS1 family transposase n=1 Tax=Niabella ginsengisoli TaxID=522298 RepID=UPI00374CA46F